MTLPLMPKATAVWLVENTALSFEQIAEFCGMHPLEVQGIADGEVAQGVRGVDPVAANQLAAEEIKRCEADDGAQLQLASTAKQYINQKTKGARYTPVARRGEKPDAIAWLVKYYPTMADAQISKLVGTTKNTIQAVRNKTHWNTLNIKPRDPVLLGLCTQTHLDAAIAKIKQVTQVGAEAS
ncbi:MAG: cell cycle transcriptional regulator TrcR [Alphaproteobacteria bacterium]|nr:cell cycle transcriptional regulator TrcR [Alphaproteobacteria bacterium]